MCNLLIALALVTSAPITTSEVTATRLDGTSVVGELRAWELGHVVVATPNSEQRLATDELLSLAWKPVSPRSAEIANATSGQIELVDGTLIPLTGVTITAKQAAISLPASLAAQEKSLTIPRRQLAAVQLQPLAGPAAEQWSDIRNTDFASDVLVLLKRDGQSLDYAEGVLGDISAEKIELELDGEPLRIDREKAAGFIFYRRQDQTESQPRCVVHGRSGLRANVANARLTNGVVEFETVSGAAFDWPLHDIWSSDFSAGKLLFLSDLEPATEKWTPLIGMPAETKLIAEYGRPRRNQSAFGGPLMLRGDDPLSASSGGHARQFNKGLALRSRTELVYRLPPGFRRFTTVAGIDPSALASGNVHLQIYGNDRLIFEDAIAGHQSPRPIELDISGIKRLKILVDYGQNLDTGDWLNLCDARIVK